MRLLLISAALIAFDLQMVGYGRRDMMICNVVYTCDQQRLLTIGFIFVSNVAVIAALILDYFSEGR